MHDGGDLVCVRPLAKHLKARLTLAGPEDETTRPRDDFAKAKNLATQQMSTECGF
jgi:hypothetical protein